MADLTITTPGAGSVTVPAGMNSVLVELHGAGGGAKTQLGFKGGGGGAFASRTIAVTPGQTLNYEVGIGGHCYNGTTATDTWFGDAATVLAKSGYNGDHATMAGRGGQSYDCVGDVRFSGGDGFGTQTDNILFGGGGAASRFGSGCDQRESYGGGSPGGGTGGGISNIFNGGAAGQSNPEGGGGSGGNGAYYSQDNETPPWATPSPGYPGGGSAHFRIAGANGQIRLTWSTSSTLPATDNAWTPTMLGSTVKAWTKFNELTGADGSSVTAFTDTTGRNYTGNALVKLGYLAPGMKSLRRTSNGENLVSTGNLAITGGAPRMAFIVSAEYEPGHNGNIMALGGQPSSMAAMDLWCQSGSWAWHLNGPAVANGGTLSRDSTRVLCMAYTGNSSTGEMQMWQDGQNKGIYQSVVNGQVPNTALGPIRLLSGAHTGLDNPAVSNVTLDIGEVIVCDTYVSDDDQRRIEGYLAHKWGVTSRLPANHPYKTSAPTLTAAVEPPAAPTRKAVRHSYWL